MNMGSVGRGNVRELFDAHKSNHSDLKVAQKVTALELREWIKTGEIEPADVSIKECFKIFVEEQNPDLDLEFSDFGDIREAIVSSQFPKITGELINSTFITAYELNIGSLMSLVEERTSNRREETIAGTTPGERASQTEEGAPFSEIQIGEKYVQIPNKKFGKGVSLTKEMILFDQTGDLVRFARENGEELGTSLASFICYRLTDTAWSELDLDGTSRSYIINGTRRAIYADSHASWNTYANDSLAAAALPTIGVVKGMRKQLKAMVNENGDKIVTSSPVVFTNDLLEDDMNQFFHAQDFEIDSANRNKNIYQNTVKLVVSPFFPDLNNWFLGNPARQFILQWVWKPRTDTDNVGDARRQIVGSWWSSFMCGIGAQDHRFVIKNAYAG